MQKEVGHSTRPGSIDDSLDAGGLHDCEDIPISQGMPTGEVRPYSGPIPGLSAQELLGRGWKDFIPPENRK